MLFRSHAPLPGHVGDVHLVLNFDYEVPSEPGSEDVYKRQVWNSIPSQLFKENKKFIYGALRKGARANDFEMAIQWLVNDGLLYKVPRCTKPELPLDIYAVSYTHLVELTEQEQNDLREGKKIFVEGMTARSGNPFDAHLQVNAERRGVEFILSLIHICGET